MSKALEVLVDRKDLRRAQVRPVERVALQPGEVRLAVERFALTSNNVSYAVSGDMIGYWGFFPGPEGWGKVPVWGFAEVIESACGEVPVGDRVYGFLPMAGEVVMRPGKVNGQRWIDIAPHRAALPALYNGYMRTAGEDPALGALVTERCLLFPLFVTSWVLSDYLIDNDWFGAGQVAIGSASSKTGFGLAQLLAWQEGERPEIVGLTSPGNVGFVEGLGCYDRVLAYEDAETLDASKPAAFVDMSGDGPLTARLHHHFGDNLVESCMVGATHWETERRSGQALPGAKPAFFFAPTQIAKRNAEWGDGAAIARAYAASARLSASAMQQIQVEEIDGLEAAARVWGWLLDNRIDPKRGLMIRP